MAAKAFVQLQVNYKSVFVRSVRLIFHILLALSPSLLLAQEGPYFVTYDHHMEEPGNLEFSTNALLGSSPRAGNSFMGNWTEFEYGVKGWWTTELYLDAQSTWGESALFTGFRWENRFRPLMGEHKVNPILYAEYENLSGADKTFKEVVGFDSGFDNLEPNSQSRRETEREIETKLILSSDFNGWNVAGNFLAEKNLAASEPWEFGYAFGASRLLASAATPAPCTVCRENFRAGLELYGGLGTQQRFTLRATSHYLAPLLAWDLPRGVTLRVSPTFGLTRNSHPFMIRFGISYEIPGFGGRVRRWFD
jgi:hypothetical protein